MTIHHYLLHCRPHTALRISLTLLNDLHVQPSHVSIYFLFFLQDLLYSVHYHCGAASCPSGELEHTSLGSRCWGPNVLTPHRCVVRAVKAKQLPLRIVMTICVHLPFVGRQEGGPALNDTICR